MLFEEVPEAIITKIKKVMEEERRKKEKIEFNPEIKPEIYTTPNPSKL